MKPKVAQYKPWEFSDHLVATAGATMGAVVGITVMKTDLECSAAHQLSLVYLSTTFVSMLIIMSSREAIHNLKLMILSR